MVVSHEMAAWLPRPATRAQPADNTPPGRQALTSGKHHSTTPPNSPTHARRRTSTTPAQRTRTDQAPPQPNRATPALPAGP